MFNIINLDTSCLYAIDGDIQAYATGGDASLAARMLTERTGIKHQPRRVASAIDWRERERCRCKDGAYIPVPWSTDETGRYPDGNWCHAWDGYMPITDHFVHMSKEEPGKVAFTEDADKGAADRQTRMRPGRYLERFYSHQSSDKREYWTNVCARLYDPADVKFADTQDEIVRVYTNGPSSCMAHKAGDYQDGHPTRVYAAGDLAIAYLTSQDDATRIVARCVCWPERKVYSRIYGDAVRLEAALDRLGYHADDGSELEGARLLLIESGTGYVMPYIDNYNNVSVKRGYLIIDDRGDIDAQVTEGVSGGTRCARCNDAVHDDDTHYVEDVDQSWCENCYSNHTFYCDGTQETYSSNTESYAMYNGETWCERHFERHGVTCDATGRHVPTDDSVTLQDGTVWSCDYFERHGYQCAECGEAFELGERCGDCETDDETPTIAGRDNVPEQLNFDASI